MSVWAEYVMKVVNALAFFCVALHLLLLVFQSSLICDLVVPAFMTYGNVFHVFLLTLPVVAVLCMSPSRLDLKKPGWQQALLCGLLYTALVVFASAHLCSDITDWSRVVLIPLTILSLTFCAPMLLNRSFYRWVFFALAGLFALHTLFVVFCMLTDTTSVFGRSLVQGPGREKDLFGLILPKTDGLYSNSNTLGSFLMYLPAVLLSEAMIAGRFLSSAATLLLSMVSLGLLGSFSRGAQLTVLLGGLFPAVQLSKRSRVLSIVISIFLVALMVITMQPSVNCSSQSHLSNVRTSSGEGRSLADSDITSGRFDLWRKAMADIGRSPVLGTGYCPDDSGTESPHNFLLANLLYFGCLGTIALVSMLALLCKSILQRIRTGEYPELVPVAGVLAAIILIHGQLEYVLTYPLFFSNSMFWFLLGYVAFANLDICSSGSRRPTDSHQSRSYANSECL